MNKPSDYYQRKRKELTIFIPKRYFKVLEIGCAEGNFRENLNQECEYWGVEPFAAAAEVAMKKLDKVLVGTYQEIKNSLPKYYFDLVICNDVIEHMVDPDEFFQTIKEYINKDGCLVGSIPNVRYISNLFRLLMKKDWKYTDQGILDDTHLRFYTEKSLKRTISENGFVIEQFQGINPYRTGAISLKIFFEKCLYYFTILIYGMDIKFKMFGFRIRCK